MPGAIGLSIEAKELATEDLNPRNRPLVLLMRGLGPAVLRVGGNSLDLSWWTSKREPPPGWATSVVTPADLVRLRGLLAAAGWQVILGVNLGHFEPQRAAEEAEFARHIFGSRLLGFEIGNEPNDYGGSWVRLRPSTYSVEEYLSELRSYASAMRAVVPALRLYGPDLGWEHAQPWLSEIASSGAAVFAELTQHYYPTTYSFARGACPSTSIPSARQLLSLEVREAEDAALKTIIEAGALAHLPTRISETNDTSSCDAPGGPETSPVFASALWSLDWVLRAVSAGVSGLNFHGYLGLCGTEAFAPMCVPEKVAPAQRHLVARPEYYGLLAARQLEGGRFVPAHLTSSTPLPNITTWATVSPRGIVRIAIDNLGFEGAPQPISIPDSGYAATSQTLAGASIESANDVTFGGTSIRAGRWRPRITQASHPSHPLRVVVRPESALIVTLRPLASAH